MEAMDAKDGAAMMLVQNMMVLCKQLRLPVSYKILERVTPSGGGGGGGDGGKQAAAAEALRRRFSIVVHVHGDHAFKKYLQNCSASDLLLYRGLLLQVEATRDLSCITAARVQQAFLPKFENEGQDAAVADSVVEAAASAGRPTVVTVKHSGSLVTLSRDGGWAAKNSVGNEYTAGGAALLRAHYDRRNPTDPAAAAAEMQRLFDVMRERRLSLCFEMVTGSHGHHGQLPAAEYLVATAAHSLHPHTSAPAFLGWLPFMELCAEVGLPANDTWLLAGGPMAAAGRQALDGLALRGGPTGHALRVLGQLVEEGAQSDPGCLHLPGAYPHDQWQGERLEGFVVAAGQPQTEEDLCRLRAVRDSMAASRLLLTSTPEHLRRPYQRALREALADAAAAAALATAGKGRSNGTAGADRGGDGAAGELLAAAVPGGPATEAVRSRLQVAAAGWVPQTAVPYMPVPLEARDKLTELLASQALGGLVAEGGAAPHYLPLPSGGRLYCRLALSKLGAQRLQALLAAEAEAAGCPAPRAAALREAAAEAAMADDPPPDMLLVRAMRALAGGPEAAVTLRYKKKMMGWSWPEAQPATAADGGGIANGSGNANGSDGSGSGGGGVVGYSLMTFVVRNGLAALKQGPATYSAYVENLTRRSWGLSPALAAQVQHFARCWAAWVAARGGAGAVESYRYLDTAEPFAAEFLARRGAMALSGRPEGAFQGILICVDTPEPLTAALRRAVAPSLEIQTAKLGDTAFSKGMVPGGAMLWLQPGGDMPKQLRNFMAAGAAPFTWVVTAAPPQQGAAAGDGEGRDAKRQKGIAASKIAAVTAALGPDGGSARLRQVTPPAAEDDPDGAATAKLAAELAGWLGGGTPLPPADPAVAAFFVTIPGAGKSALARGLTVPAAAEGGGAAGVTVKILNSDTLKKTVKGFNPNRYWLEVASATDSCLGGGHAVVAVADKNLVPSPPGNIARALEPLKGLAGLASLALVPVVSGPSTASRPAPPHAAADLYGGLPDLPFPLELVALCMLRTLQRKNHEGGLDGASAPAAATVVAMFAGFYRHKTLGELTEALRGQFTAVAELPLMRGDGEGEGGSGGTVPTDVLRHVAAGLRDVNERNKPQLPIEWETRARQLLLRPDVVAALEALQLPIPEVRAHLERELAAALAAARAAAAAAAAAETQAGAAAAAGTLMPAPSLSGAVADLYVDGGTAAAAAAAAGGDAAAADRVSYISVSGIDEEALRAAARGVLPAEMHGRLRRAALHVTLWHRNDPVLGPRVDLRTALLGLVGSPVELQVAAIDVSPEVVAAEVTLLSADEAITAKPYHHITLLVEKGHTAAESNLLPGRLAAREAGVQRLELAGGPLMLTGVVTAVEAEEQGGGGGGGGGGGNAKKPPVV